MESLGQPVDSARHDVLMTGEGEDGAVIEVLEELRREDRPNPAPGGGFEPRTAAPPDSNEPVRFAYWSCQDWTHGFYNAHEVMARVLEVPIQTSSDTSAATHPRRHLICADAGVQKLRPRQHAVLPRRQ